LNADYFGVAEELIPAIRSELTVVGGRCVHSTGEVGP
jgi:predicted amidohydrolase YtcJ